MPTHMASLMYSSVEGQGGREGQGGMCATCGTYRTTYTILA